MPVNDAETKLRHLLLSAGFGEGVRGEQIQLGNPLGTTTPDVIYRADEDGPDEGACIYLDGLSQHLHGNPETAERDREIRTWLRNTGYEVIEIAASELVRLAARARLGIRAVQERCPPLFVCNPSVNIRPAQGF